MNIVSAILVFVMIWWCVIFCVLPLGQSTMHENDEEGVSAPGAPKSVDMKKKVILTTLISVVIFGIVYAFIISGLIDFREMAKQELLHE